MKSKRFPIWRNLNGWSNFYHFFHLVSSCQEGSLLARQIADLIIPIYVYLKLTSLPLVVSKYPNSMFRKIIGGLLTQVISLEFLESKYIILLIFAFLIVFTFHVLYYYFHHDELMIRHVGPTMNFVLEAISPILVNIASSNIHITAKNIIDGKSRYLILGLAIACYLISTFYCFLGTLFRSSEPSKDSISHAFIKHTDYFWLIQLPCFIQQLWIIDKLYDFGIYIILTISLTVCFLILRWNSTIPFVTAKSNIFAIKVFGTSLLTILTLYFAVSGVLSELASLLLVSAFVVVFCVYGAKRLFSFFCKLIRIRSRFNPKNLIDIDNYIILPHLSHSLFIQLIHYLIVINFKEINILLVAAIDSERDPELTLECAKLLMIHSIIPHRVREMLLDFDIKSVSFLSRPTLCEIQYKMDKFKNTDEDIGDCLQILDNAKQKAKIALYAFVNSLVDSSEKKQKYTNSINYALQSYEYCKMAEYAIEGNPMSCEIITNYYDYLIHCTGDFKRSNELFNLSNKIHNSFINISGNTHPFVDNQSKFNIQCEADIEQNITYQKALDIIVNYPQVIFITFATILGIMLIFPVFTINWFLNSFTFNPEVYFSRSHSPVQFKTTFCATLLEVAFSKFGRTLPSNINLLSLEPIAISTLRQYLNSIICPTDKKPIFSGAGQDAIDFPENFYSIMTNQVEYYEDNQSNIRIMEETQKELDKMYEIFDKLIDRYFITSKETNDIVNFKMTTVCFAITIILAVVLALVTLILYKRYIFIIINVMESIEMTTLEEFRSKLFLSINQNKSTIEGDQEIDNDGALELEEIETNEVNHFGQVDYTDLLEHSLNAPLSLNLFDAARPKTLIFYIFLLIVFRYLLCPLTFLIYRSTKSNYVLEQIKTQKEINYLSNVLLQFHVLIVNMTGTSLFSPKKITINSEYDKDMNALIMEWNQFTTRYTELPQMYNINYTFIKFYKIYPYVTKLYKQSSSFSESNAMYGESLYWFGTFLIIFLYICAITRFSMVQKYVQESIRRLILILHSKCSASILILMNDLSLDSGNHSFNFDEISEQIVKQLRDPVIFFNADLIVTGVNQQATAQLNLSDYLYHLETILPIPDNKDLFKYLFNIRLAYGVRARRCFDFIVETKEGKKPFSGCLIPITRDNTIEYAITMRDRSDIIEMKKDMDFLKMLVQRQLKRLIPLPVFDMMVDDNIQQIFSSDESAVLCVRLNKVNNKTPDENSYILDECDITQMALSIFDKLVLKYTTITKLRSFNGNFIFVSSLFSKQSVEVSLKNLLDFVTDFAIEIHKNLDYEYLFSASINCGGQIFGSLIGITKTLFDVWGDSMINCFDCLDLVPPGKILFLENAYEKFSNKDDLSLYVVQRELPYKLYVTNSYIGMNFDYNL